MLILKITFGQKRKEKVMGKVLKEVQGAKTLGVSSNGQKPFVSFIKAQAGPNNINYAYILILGLLLNRVLLFTVLLAFYVIMFWLYFFVRTCGEAISYDCKR